MTGLDARLVSPNAYLATIPKLHELNYSREPLGLIKVILNEPSFLQ